MNLGKLAITVALSAASSTVLAGGFDGPFAQLGIGFVNAQSQLSFPGWLDIKVNDDSFAGEGALGYSRSFGSFNLAASVSYTLGDHKAGSFVDNGYQSSVYLKLRNTWHVSVEPGFNLNESTLLYATLGYSGTTANYIEYDTKGTFPWEQRLNGYSFGVGLKYKFTPNIYGMAGIRQTNFQSREIDFGGVYPPASFQPNSLDGMVGVGYKF